jgi:predicted Zn-dependent peptidase
MQRVLQLRPARGPGLRPALDIVGGAMASIRTTTVPSNELPVNMIPLPGTRALTVLVAFNAGARNERPEENGMAHFLEHLVFKGGEKYPHYKDVNETAERLGGVLNAYTSHDIVAFHITVRAESASEAIDLLTDFVGRPHLDAEELDRERGVVIQEINRAYDQPSMIAEYLIDRAAFGEHPLGRTVLGPEENLKSFTREGIVAFRERRWAGARGGAFLVGNLDHVPQEQELLECFGRFPALATPEPFEPAPEFVPETLVEKRETNQSHLRMIYRPEISVTDVRQRAALSIYSTLLGGSMGSRLFDEIREKRGLCYSVYAVNHAFADVPILQLGSGLDSEKCIEAYTRMREIVDELRRDGPREDEVVRARAYAAGRTVLGFEGSDSVARHAASMKIVADDDIDPDSQIAAIDAVTFDDVREVAAGISEEFAVAVVGPHDASEF